MFFKTNFLRQMFFKTNVLRQIFFKTNLLREMFSKTNLFKTNVFEDKFIYPNPDTRNLLEQNMTQ